MRPGPVPSGVPQLLEETEAGVVGGGCGGEGEWVVGWLEVRPQVRDS